MTVKSELWSKRRLRRIVNLNLKRSRFLPFFRRECYTLNTYTSHSSPSSSMSERHRRELEEKRARLAELKRARDERKALLAQGEKAQAQVC